MVVVDDDGAPVGIFTEHDAVGFDRFTPAAERDEPRPDGRSRTATSPAEIFERLSGQRLSVAPVVDGRPADRRASPARARCARRSTSPAVDADGRLRIAVAVGINGDPAAKAKALLAMGADVLVIDTAHGHQTRTLRAIEEVRAVVAATRRSWPATWSPPEGTRDLIDAGADIVKVGVGPGRHVHDADDDRRRPAAVLRGARVRGRGGAGTASTSGPTAACATRATSRWRWPPGRRA